MKAIGWSVIIVGACSVTWPAQVGAQGATAPDLPRGAVRRLGSVNLRHDCVLSAAFTPDGSILITAGRDIRVWDARTRRLVRTIPLEHCYVRQMHITPHVAQNTFGYGGSAIDARTTRHEGYRWSHRKRKLIEQAFGWMKTVGLLRKLRHRGGRLVDWMFTFGAAAYNPVRWRNLVTRPA